MPNEIVLVSIPKDELQTLIIDSVNACLKFYLPKPEGDSLPELLTRKQAADFLKCSLGTVDNLTRSGVLQKHFLGRSPKFKKEELLQAFESWKKFQRL